MFQKFQVLANGHLTNRSLPSNTTTNMVLDVNLAPLDNSSAIGSSEGAGSHCVKGVFGCLDFMPSNL